MTEAESFVKLSMLGGALGAICWSFVVRALVHVADAIQAWEDKRARIGAARARARVRSINSAISCQQ